MAGAGPTPPQTDRVREAARGRLPDLKGTLTHDNLLSSLRHDAQVSVLYRYFARIADIEGYPEVATTLRELAEQHDLVADGHVDFLKRVGDPLTGKPVGETWRNLAAALTGEVVSATERLPGMAVTAHAEGFPDIASWFESAAAARAAHAQRLRDATTDGEPAP